MRTFTDPLASTPEETSADSLLLFELVELHARRYLLLRHCTRDGLEKKRLTHGRCFGHARKRLQRLAYRSYSIFNVVIHDQRGVTVRLPYA